MGRAAFACLWALLAGVGLAAWGGAVRGAPPAARFGWRGDGTGLFPKATPPLEWHGPEQKNILWQARVGKSHSSPVLVAGRVVVTAEKDWLLCVDGKTGKVLWKKDCGFDALPPDTPGERKRQRVGPGGGYSLPTPVTDGTLVYASFGTGIVLCCDLDGETWWIRYFDVRQATDYGRSASPLLADRKLVVSIGGLIALDPRTGDTLWQTTEARPSYGTPALARIGDVSVALTPNGDCVRVSDGRILASEAAAAEYSSPLVHEGVVYYAGSRAVALKLPDMAADALQLAKLWENEDLEGEFFASPLLHEGILYCVSNEGTLYALDASTGRTVFAKELDIPCAAGRPGLDVANLYSSLTLVGRHILVMNDVGHTLVLAPGREYREVGRSYLGKGSGASPVADGNHLFLRGGPALYCVGAR